MKKEEFIKHITVNGYEIDIGLDDYGQCYFYEYTDRRGVLQEGVCGTYNLQYIEHIFYELDPIYKELTRLYLNGEIDKPKLTLLKHYERLIADFYKDENGKDATECLFSNYDWDVKKNNNKLIISHFTNCHFDNELTINLEDYSVTAI